MCIMPVHSHSVYFMENVELFLQNIKNWFSRTSGGQFEQNKSAARADKIGGEAGAHAAAFGENDFFWQCEINVRKCGQWQQS